MNKIEALKLTIYNLENDVYEYKWSWVDTCNCGVLSRTILGGKKATECGFCESPKVGNIGAFARKAFCMTTNLPLPLVFQSLKDAGFTYQELLELEGLGNKAICDRAGTTSLFSSSMGMNFSDRYDEKETLIKYLTAWVEILEAEQKPATPEAKTDFSPVTFTQIKETIPVLSNS